MSYTARKIEFLAVSLIALFALPTNAQTLPIAQLKGVWQQSTGAVSAGLHANFQFYEDGRFVYNRDSYDELNPLISISGQYLLGKNSLKLKVLKVKILEKFKVIESNPGMQFDPFQMKGGEIVTIEQQDTAFTGHELTVANSSKNGQLKIQIDSDSYFKIADDPDKFKYGQKP